jgi:hypothetical protein
MIPCKKLSEAPSVVTEWQQTAWCPDCEHYDRGTCVNPTRTGSSAPCPFDGDALPLREVANDPDDDHPETRLDAASCGPQESQPRSPALEQDIMQRIVQRTGGRIQMLEVETIDSRVVIRGRAPCYHLKQLALQGVLDVLGSGGAIGIELTIEVAASPSKLEAEAR